MASRSGGTAANEQAFANFAKLGDIQCDGKSITLTNADKWLIQAKILDERNITRTDTGVCFNKFKSRTINYQQFVKFLEDLAASKNLDAQEMKITIFTCPLPSTEPDVKGGKGSSKY